MSKKLITQYDGLFIRSQTRKFYRNKYYSLYLNNYKFKELNYQQNDFIFRKYWSIGKISVFKIPTIKGYAGLCFTLFSPMQYNNYDFPTKCKLINNRGVKFIPTKTMNVDKDVVLGFAQRNLKSVKEMVDFYIEKIVSLEMLINIQMIVHKMPFLIGATEENKERIKEFMDSIVDDKPVIFCEMDEVKLFKALVSGAPYVMDKIYNQKQAYENELLSFLGINNLGSSEKKEHLITSEVESNDMIVKEYADSFVDMLEEFADRVEKVFGMKLTLECKSDLYLQVKEQEENENEENEVIKEKEEE